jgi:hypothetical protein
MHAMTRTHEDKETEELRRSIVLVVGLHTGQDRSRPYLRHVPAYLQW